MKKIIIKQLDLVGVIINNVEMDVEPSSDATDETGTFHIHKSKSRFFITSNDGKLLGTFKVYGDENGDISRISFING